MIRLDHFVVNIDNNESKLEELKKVIEPLGYPFEPKWGKGTKGFKVANIWIGLQYFEMVWLKKIDGGGWKKDWVEKYNNGHRGIIALYLMTDELDKIREGLLNRGVKVSEPERISFRWFFGLLKKSMPWRSIYTDPIPGTDLQICYGEMDNPKMIEKMKQYMVPNADTNEIVGIKEAVVKINSNSEAINYIKKLFPEIKENNNILEYEMDTTKLTFQLLEEQKVEVQLKATTNNSDLEEKKFKIENIEVINVKA